MRFTRTRPSTSLAVTAAAFGLSRSFAAVCASSYDRSAVRPTTFNSHPPRMDIHSTRRSFQRTSTSLPLFLSLSLCSFHGISLPSTPASLCRSPYAFAIRVFQSAIHAWRNITQWIYPERSRWMRRRWQARVYSPWYHVTSLAWKMIDVFIMQIVYLIDAYIFFS